MSTSKWKWFQARQTMFFIYLFIYFDWNLNCAILRFERLLSSLIKDDFLFFDLKMFVLKCVNGVFSNQFIILMCSVHQNITILFFFLFHGFYLFCLSKNLPFFVDRCFMHPLATLKWYTARMPKITIYTTNSNHPIYKIFLPKI